jgi:uncharacterized RDD family membrane protein YckC
MGAWLVDAAILLALFFAFLLAGQAIAGHIPPSSETGIDWMIDRAIVWRRILLPGAVLLLALVFVYSTLFHSLGGRTPGKRLFGLTLVDQTGLPPKLPVAAKRALLSFLSAAPLWLGFAWVLLDKNRQALHDKLTHTFVVRLME